MTRRPGPCSIRPNVGTSGGRRRPQGHRSNGKHKGALLKDLLEFLASIGGFGRPETIEPLRGLSNRNFAVVIHDEVFVVRMASKRADRLGISREAELEALCLAQEAGIGPEVLHYALPEGHMITRWLPAQEIGQRPERYREPDVLRSAVRTVKRIHALPAIEHTFDPIDRIRRAFRLAAEHDVSLPDGTDRALGRLDAVEDARGALRPEDTALCHNDLFAGNLLDADPVRVIDWEFSGMGDVFFDLATLGVATDEFAPLSGEHRSIILTEYFGDETVENRRRLDDMVFVVRLHVVAWGLTHHVLGTPAHGWEGFTFLGFATELLRQLVADVPKREAARPARPLGSP